MSARSSKALALTVLGVAAAFLIYRGWAPSPLDEAKSFNDAAWVIVKSPAESKERYQSALRDAERACSMEPDRAGFLNTLGLAQYRVGHYAEALSTLERSRELNQARQDRPHSPAYDWIAIALVQSRLGNEAEARKALVEGRRHAEWDANEELRGLLQEADALVGRE